MSGELHVVNLGKSYRQWASEWRRVSSWFVSSIAPREEHWALKDVSFSIGPGEAVGVIGQNGAGKSTLLKLITGVTRPTQGAVRLSGRVSAILEHGMGFNPDLTGRENAYRWAGLMGHPQSDIQRAMPEIEAFAEIGAYFDQPMRTYSSGVQMRVAFSVATAFKPDLLIVDEALPVGDSHFRHKSFARMRQFRDDDASIILVSHSLGDVHALCDRVILLDKGRVLKDGLPDEVVDYYGALIADKESANMSIEQRRERRGGLHTEHGTRRAVVESIRLLDAQTGAEVGAAAVGQELVIETQAVTTANLPKLILGHRITDRAGRIVWGTTTWHTRQVLENVPAGNRITFRARFKCTLGPGAYAVWFGVVTSDAELENCYHKVENPLGFDVVNLDKPNFIGSTWLDTTFASQIVPITPLRIAIVSTPRSGNTWLRYMLAALYQAEQIAVHTPNDIDWQALPQGNLIVQTHWHRTPELARTLRQYDFKIVVLHRHPLDVLISILQFAPREPDTACWLSGEGGDERAICGVPPTSSEFLAYCTGPRAQALLSVSIEWSRDPDAALLCYEDLVQNPNSTVTALTSCLGPTRVDIGQVIERNALDRLRPTAPNGHFWQGTPGHWRKLIPAEFARRVADAQREAFDAFGYECRPDMSLQDSDAETIWRELCH
jgi:lipopolysaccharide transport system ATP-binding protein